MTHTELETWEAGDTAAHWTPAFNGDDSDDAAPRELEGKRTETWRLTYYRGRYWHVSISRRSQTRWTNYTLYGAFINDPCPTWKRGTGMVPFIWCGPQVAVMQSFKWDHR